MYAAGAGLDPLKVVPAYYASACIPTDASPGALA